MSAYPHAAAAAAAAHWDAIAARAHPKVLAVLQALYSLPAGLSLTDMEALFDGVSDVFAGTHFANVIGLAFEDGVADTLATIRQQMRGAAACDGCSGSGEGAYSGSCLHCHGSGDER